MTPPVELTLDTPAGRVSALLLAPPQAFAGLTFAHGAGAGMHHRFMAAVAEELAAAGVASLRFQFPSREAGKSRPDTPDVAVATVRAAVAEAVRHLGGLPLFAGGKSFGGRMTSTAAADPAGLDPVKGLVFFGFPLHPPKRAATTRGDHLDRVAQPMLFLQGTRDDLADVALIRRVKRRLGARATLHIIDEANHAFAVPKRTGKTEADVMAELAGTAATWMKGIIGAASG